jgi:type II secretory pathway predicted ATPase ExeA
MSGYPECRVRFTPRFEGVQIAPWRSERNRQISMLDVYRTFYGFTGEPFRLGPDYRFSLHHTSYANAKAYLEFAIYQGEGFIAITGGPGTGKTTLISEILANLDRDNMDVATLNSTQLESRDLLQMVASSFGLQPEQHNKADLLLEIERFLIKELRSGHRAILIVDEAQGLSAGALEELRQLANLQYQYQLLLQIVLVGQERLLELIRAPGMEHLQQRLLAATSLEPLGFDETIDYIEHRLSRVGWQGDPSIAEAALRLIYRYSGGIPRRINLITNRLFLYGGMEEKHQLTGDDAESVLEGLIAEFLLPREPMLEEAAIPAPKAAGSGKTKPRSLPRRASGVRPAPGKKGGAAGGKRPQAAAARGSAEPGRSGGARPAGKNPAAPAPNAFKMDRESIPGSRRQPAAEQQADGEEAQRTVRRPPAGARGAQPPHGRRAGDRGRRAADRERRPEPKRGSNRSVILVALLLAGAGLAYFIEKGSSVDLRPIHAFFGKVTGLGQPGELSPPIEGSMAPIDGDFQGDGQGFGDVTAGSVADAPGTINRSGAVESDSVPGTTAVEDNTVSGIPQPETAGSTATDQTDTAAHSEDATVEGAATEPEVEVVEVPTGDTDTAPRTPATVSAADAVPIPEPTTDAAAAETKVAVAAPVPPKPATASAAAAGATAAVTNETVLEGQRARLRQAAEQRYSEQVTRGQPASEKVAASRPTTKKPEPAPQQIAKADTATAQSAARPARKSAAEVKDILLKGRWSSSGNPATLLPSQKTYCHTQVGNISCVSVPQNVKTQYGPALYKVNTTLSGFAAGGHFEMSYRTMVRLVSEDSAEPPGDTDKDQNWQVTEYAMSCELEDAEMVSCLDGKGITRRYNRAQ